MAMKIYGDLRKWVLFSCCVKQVCVGMERLMRFLNVIPHDEEFGEIKIMRQRIKNLCRIFHNQTYLLINLLMSYIIYQ